MTTFKHYSNVSANARTVRKGALIEFASGVQDVVIKVSRGHFWTRVSAPYPSFARPADVRVIKYLKKDFQ